MKKFLLGTVGLIALGVAPASAADLAPRPYTKAPPMVAAVYDWSGFYIGANGGWGNQHSCFNAVDSAGTFLGAEGCHNGNGGVAGGQIGYRWEVNQWVFGLEAQGTGLICVHPIRASSFPVSSIARKWMRSGCSPARLAMPGTTSCST
jgi:outer membrane immunogenic protein